MNLDNKESQVRRNLFQPEIFRKRGLEVRAVRRVEPSKTEDVEDATEKLLKSR